MGLKVVQTNFSAGEIDPLLDMRTDIAAYANAARRLRNVALLNQGGVTRRPGTYDLASLVGKAKLHPFEFSADERYVVAFSSGRADFFNMDGTLLQTLTSCPWTVGEAFELTVAQAADTMVIAHRNIPTQRIRRTSATSFVRELFDYRISGQRTYQPYFKFAKPGATITPSGATGSITVTSNQSVFVAGHVGTYIRYYDREILVTGYTSATQITGTAQGRLLGQLPVNPFTTKRAEAEVEVDHPFHGLDSGQSITFRGCEGVGGYTEANLNATHTVTVINKSKYTITLGTNATSSAVGGGPGVRFLGTNVPTRNWDEAAFSTLRGWPGAVCFHEDRLWFGGAFSIPNGIWGSKIGEYDNFDVGEGLDDESVQLTVGGNQISDIRYLVSNRDLQIFTSTSEHVIPRPQGGSITPTAVAVAPQTPFGCARIAPQLFEGASIFVQATKTALREFLYVDMENAYQSGSISFLAEHLLANPQDMAITYGSTKRGEQYLMLVNADGTMPVFHSARAEKLAGWTLWSTTHPSGLAYFRSICQIGNFMFFCTERNGVFRLERLAGDDLELTLDGARRYSVALPGDPPEGTWTVSPIYRNTEVTVITGDNQAFVVEVNASDQLTLPQGRRARNITVGYAYAVEIETLPINVVLQDGDYSGRPKRIVRVIAGLNKTQSFQINGNRLWLYQTTDDFSEAPDVVTARKEFFLTGWSREATVTITQSEPLPMRITGLAMEVQA